MSSPQYNTRNAGWFGSFPTESASGVKRLMKEAMELKEPTDLYAAQPFADNLFEWHFTVKGPSDSDFDGGIYHGRIIFPSDYPMKPPNLMILTPNGRFELNKKICLSISGYHPETWLPSWSVRTALLALIGFMPSEPGGAIGGLDYPPEERKRLARLSTNWTCKECGLCMKNALQSMNSAGIVSEVSSNTGENLLDKKPSQTENIAESNEHIIGIQRQVPVESNGISLFVLSAITVALISIFVILVMRRLVS